MPAAMADLATLWAPHQPALQDALTRVVTSGQAILGPQLEAFEATMAKRIGTGFALGVSSGTDALTLALRSVGVGAGDLVITTPYSFVATASAIVQVGARPVFVDVNPADLNLCPEASQAWLEQHPELVPRVKAILPVHLFGGCADLAAFSRLAARFDAHLIEDAAQALDAQSPGAQARAGSVGRVGCFSFYPTKNLGALGDGGLVVTDDEALASRLRRLRSHGDPESLGGNHRLDEVQAAWLRVLLAPLDGWTQTRQAHARAYDAVFADRPERPLARAEGHVCHQYVVRVPDGPDGKPRRDALRHYLHGHGVQTAIYYERPLHLQARFQDPDQPCATLPHAEQAAAQTVALPVHPALAPEAFEHVLQTLRNAPL